MSLKERMSRTFDNFWNIDLGHVFSLFVFLFVAGVAWQKQSDRISAVETRAEVLHQAEAEALKNAVNERNLKLESIVHRVEQTEQEIKIISALNTQVAVIGTELNGIKVELQGVRTELRRTIPKMNSAQ